MSEHLLAMCHQATQAHMMVGVHVADEHEGELADELVGSLLTKCSVQLTERALTRVEESTIELVVESDPCGRYYVPVPHERERATIESGDCER